MRRLFLLSFSLVGFGCYTSSTYPHVQLSEAWQTEINQENLSGKETSSPQQVRWWEVFKNQELNSLIQRATSSSPTLLGALGRVQEARSTYKLLSKNRFPRLSASSLIGRGEERLDDAASSFFEAAFDVSYELDLFGKIETEIQTAQYQSKTAYYQMQHAELTLRGEVARNYIILCEANAQRNVTHRNIAIQEETTQLVERQTTLGERNKLDLVRARAQVRATRAALAQVNQRVFAAKTSLRVLVGDMTNNEPITCLSGKIPKATLAHALGTPSEVIRGRPDVAAAYSELMSAVSSTKEISLSAYPTISIGALIGIGESSFNSSKQIWKVEADNTFSVFSFGRLKKGIQIGEVRERQLLQQYRATVLDAIAEIENALFDFQELAKQTKELSEALKNAKQALFLSNTLFKVGEIAFLDVLQAQQDAIELESQLLSAESAQSQALVRIYKGFAI